MLEQSIVATSSIPSSLPPVLEQSIVATSSIPSSLPPVPNPLFLYQVNVGDKVIKFNTTALTKAAYDDYDTLGLANRENEEDEDD